MDIEVSSYGDERVHSFNLEDLFQNSMTVDEMANRLRWRIKAIARTWGVEPGYVFFSEVLFEEHDITPNGDAIDAVDNLVKFYEWADPKEDYEYLPIVAKIYTDDWKYLDFDDLDNEFNLCYHQFDVGDYEEFARQLVDDGVIEGPDEEWDYYVDWEAKGRDIAQDYQQYDYQGTTYLFGN